MFENTPDSNTHSLYLLHKKEATRNNVYYKIHVASAPAALYIQYYMYSTGSQEHACSRNSCYAAVFLQDGGADDSRKKKSKSSRTKKDKN